MSRIRIPAALVMCAVFAVPVLAQKRASKAAAKAEENYRTTCQPCHGVQGAGVLPLMSLSDGEWKHGSGVQEIAKTISAGVKGTAMLPFKDKFTRAEILELARLVRSYDKRLGAKPARPVKSHD
ncbi:MAG: cytochrome c [Acidobacteria bacterium]|nr:cytochrome c [Acidobacteriota bacterium]MCA1649819.1 cytochrome c [Acidobacteriota bacterium]